MKIQYTTGQRFSFKVGDKVICNGYDGAVRVVCNGQLQGMVEVQLDRGGVCTSASYPDCYPRPQAGLACYYPEMGEPKPAAQIEATLYHYGKHYYLKSEVRLTGRGVEYRGTLEAKDLVPAAQDKVGWHEYKVTLRAFEAICREHRVSHEMLLD